MGRKAPTAALSIFSFPHNIESSFQRQIPSFQQHKFVTFSSGKLTSKSLTETDRQTNKQTEKTNRTKTDTHMMYVKAGHIHMYNTSLYTL